MSGLAVVTFIVMVAALGSVVTLRTQRSALWAGGLLAAFGLCGSLVVYFIGPPQGEAQLVFLVNSFLVVAAVGANMFTTAICMDLSLSKPLAFRCSWIFGKNSISWARKISILSIMLSIVIMAFVIFNAIPLSEKTSIWLNFGAGCLAIIGIICIASEYFFLPKSGDSIRAPDRFIRATAGVTGLASGVTWVFSAWYSIYPPTV